MNPFAHLRHDLPASVVVFFVAVPLCLGIALASGAPLEAGLIAGIVGGIVVGVLSGSPLGVSGPAAGLAVIVLGAIEDLGAFDKFLAAVVIAGAIQFVMGLARGGVIGYFFPSSVIRGMLAGIGVIIFLKQIPHALGHDTDPEGDLSFAQDKVDSPGDENTLTTLLSTFDDFTLGAIIVSSVALAILILWEVVLTKRAKIFQIVQGPIVAVAFGILFQVLTKKAGSGLALEPHHLVEVPVYESLGEVRSKLTHPAFGAFKESAVWIVGITIAIVASLETLLCVEATDKIDPYKRTTPTSRELVAQGVGNMTSGLLGGLPLTQVIIRSSANIQSGGRTKMSAIMHGVLLLIAVLFLPKLLNLVPLAALAAILLVVGYKLAKPAVFKEMYSQGWSQFVPFLVTILGIVFTDLLTGIALGMAVAIFVILRSHYQNSHFLHMEETGETSHGRQIRMRLAEEVTFLHKGALLKELDSIPDGSHVLIDATSNIRIDQDAQEIIAKFEESAPRRDITVAHKGRMVASMEPRDHDLDHHTSDSAVESSRVS